jgi:hypothetical protein
VVPPAEGLDHVVWDLKDADKQAFVPAGEYTAALTVGATTKTQKITVLAAKK